MTHLYIELNTGLTEEVNSSIISKLYELAISGDLDNTSDLKGRLHSNMTYRSLMEYLNTTYPDLYISADDFAIPFEDPNMITYLNSIGVGSNGMITENQAAAATVVANNANTTVTKFNELKYFTGITATGTNTTRFVDWTALEEIDLSNFTRVGGATSGDWQGSFLRCTGLKKVTASSILTTFGHAAFNGCSNLELIIGVVGTVNVLTGAFRGCSKLQQSFFQPLSFLLGETTSDGEHFRECSLLLFINIAEGTTVIPVRCFYKCTNLTTIELPSTCTNIKDSAFSQCTSLSTVSEEGALATTGTLVLSHISTLGGGAFAKTNITSANFTGSTFTSTGSDALADCSNLITVVLPNTCTQLGNSTFYKDTALLSVTGLSNLTSISQYAFCNCSSLQTLDIDWSKITTIGGRCFNGSSISGTLSMPALTTASGEYEFAGCSGVTSVSSVGSIVNIDHHMFEDCTNLTLIPDLLTITGYVGYAAFKNCRKLASTINIPNATLICGHAFNGCALISLVNLGQSCTKIEQHAFTGCNHLTSITIPKNVIGIDKDAFTECSQLSSVSFESGSRLLYLEGGCFNNCRALQSISVPDSCEEIKANCFINCQSLLSVEIGSGIQTIANNAFSYNGTSPNSITMTIHATTPPTFHSYSGNQIPITAVYVPVGCVSTYEQHQDWSRFSGSIYEIPQS